MNRTEFISELERRLSSMPQDERKSAIRYYNEYFDDAGPENEQMLLIKLGSPENVAARLLEDSSIRETRAKTMSKPWAVILSILAAPIAIPLIAAALSVLLAFVMVVFSLLVVLCILAFIPGIVMFTLFASGIAMFIVGMCLIVQHFPTMLVFTGMSAVLVSLGGLIFSVYRPLPSKMARFFPKAFSSVARLALRPFRKRRRLA